MATNKEYKKPQRKADEGLEPRLNHHGKQSHQKMKPFLVLRYLLKNSDENHVVTAFDIIAMLEEYGISADRRSIYRDIDEINLIYWMADNDSDLDEAEDVISENEDDCEKLIVYDNKRKGFYVKQRRYEFDEIRLAAETIYASRFLTEQEAKTLVDVICEFVSEHQAEQIKHDVFLADRVKTDNKRTFNNISTINSAMSKELDGEKHSPEKISFKYLKYTISNLKQQAERRQGEKYFASPYALLLNNGNYYLLGYDDKAKAIRTYRVDRMRDVCLTRQPREGAEAFAAINMKDYAKSTFSMFGGKTERVTMRFPNHLLDTVVDRFGTSGVQYMRADDKHFTVTVSVAVSKQFYGWLCGIGKPAVIISPESIREDYKKHLDAIRSQYE